MGWYVFALADRAPRSAGRGFTAPLTARALAGIFVVAERRADVPPLAFDALERHARVVERLAARVPAILPVRFGTLVTIADLDEALRERGDEFRDALARVRGCVQMTWRLAGSRLTHRGGRAGLVPGFALDAESAAPAASASERSESSRSERGWGPASIEQSGLSPPELTATSGTEYLRRRAAAEHAALPAVMRPLRSAFASLVAAERFQPASATMPAALYHLVPKRRLAEYRDLASRVQRTAARPRLTLTGPWPPYAFTPEVL